MTDDRAGAARSEEQGLTAEFELIEVDFRVPVDDVLREPNPRELLRPELLRAHMAWLDKLRHLSDPALFPRDPR